MTPSGGLASERVLPVWNYAEGGDGAAALRVSIALKRGYERTRSGSWQTKAPLTAQALAGWTVRASKVSAYGTVTFVVVRDDAVLEISKGRGDISFVLSALDDIVADALRIDLEKRFPRVAPGADELLTTFWYQTRNGAHSDGRVLNAPTWTEISENYSPPVQSQMARLLDPAFVPGVGGKLILFYGPPGTGKTYALRSLVRAWREWCSASYVTDIEAWFQDASYMMSVLLHEPVVRPSATSVESVGSEREPWHLVILEDCAELITADAAIRAGQGFGRLLNATDGFLGQGLRVLLLLTTNEEIDKLHPAVSRPGRCASRIEFGPLDQQSAARWLHERGVTADVSGSQTLAGLYALAEGRGVRAAAKRVGFRPDGGRNDEETRAPQRDAGYLSGL